MKPIKILLWAALAAFMFGVFAPGCFPASDWDGRLCAAPATGGEHCVPSSTINGPKVAWDKAKADGPLPIQMWAEWPEDMTLDDLVASRDKLELWFADVDKVLTYVRVGEKNAESYQASMAGNLGALLAQAKQRQVELLEQKPVDAAGNFTLALTDKANAEKSPLLAGSNEAEAPFDSVLLRPGGNDFFFSVSALGGDNSCVNSQDLVSLVSAPLGLNKPLFNIRRVGTGFAGSTRLALALAEINPPLARDIANLEVAIAEQRAWLIANASKVADLAAKLDLLRQLDTELHDLVNRPLDEITQADLDAILDRYSEVVDDATKAALEQLIADLQKSITDLQNELYSLIDQFGAHADAVADLITQDASDTGWNPDDPSSYALGPGEMPWVDVPDISDIPGAFDPGNDPYAAYADSVIASLQADVSGGGVVTRASFVAKVRAWRANDTALEQAILAQMGVSQAEVNAFLQARIRVTTYLQQFLDASDWFLDSKIPADVRAYADGVLKQAFGQLAEQLKDNLNLWDDSTQSPELLETIRAFGGAMSTIGSGFTAYAETMQGLVHATTRIGIGFVPVVGTALDLCEAMSGKEWCLPSGRQLSTEERIFSATGAALGGVVKYYAGVKNAGVSAGAIVVAKETGELGDDFAKALLKNRRTSYKILEGAITSKPMGLFEEKAGIHLLNEGRALIGIGDDGVRRVLEIPFDSPPYSDLGKAPDFLSLIKGDELALSEAKGGAIGEAIAQLTNAVKKLKEKGLVGDLKRVEIIRPKGASLGDNNYKILNGYLVRISEGKPVAIKDVPGVTNLFVRVIEL